VRPAPPDLPAATTRPPVEVARLSAAFALAAVVHAPQVRKGSRTPYLAHLLGVTELVWNHRGTDVEAAAALLHDAVEDGGGARRLDDVRRACGPEVAAIVESCSDSTVDTSGGEAKDAWWARKTAYIDHLRSATVAPGALLVSACDKLHNLTATCADYEAVGEEIWDRFTTGWPGQLWYYRQLVAVYEASDDGRVVAAASRLSAATGTLRAGMGALGP
jgi:(p)ppGpp synthase/HD superfamily hydrolase